MGAHRHHPSLRWSLAAACSLAGSLASAGGSSSGGGELLEDTFNPWFLTSVPEVTYCIGSADDFSVPKEVLAQYVANSFDYWSDEFSNAYLPDNLLGENPAHALIVRVKTSGFKLQDCTDKVDLTFQFGTLGVAESAYVKSRAIDTRRFVAFTGRLDYDRVNLRGKGFIYVSPDRGPLAFQGDNVVPNAWTADGDNSRLGKVLTHELGHVFGLPHMGGPGSLMDQDFPEMMVSQSLPRRLTRS